MSDGTRVIGLGDIGPEAGLRNALQVVDQDLRCVKIAMIGMGAA